MEKAFHMNDHPGFMRFENPVSHVIESSKESAVSCRDQADHWQLYEREGK